MEATDSIEESPGRPTFFRAKYAEDVCQRNGWRVLPGTFEGELPKVLTHHSLLRSQYSLAFNPGDVKDGSNTS